jgi:hypothetical protein
MRKRLTTLRSKSGGTGAQNGNGNGNPRSLVDEIVYREHQSFLNATLGNQHWDPQYSGWSNASRSKDHPIFLRNGIPVGGVIAPPINLGTGANYAIFGFAGITNVPTSAITGNMGAYPVTSSSITGFSLSEDVSDTFFTSTQVTGRIYAADNVAPTPAALVLAHSDILAAYTSAQDLAATHPANFNAGGLGSQTLTPGVWNWTTAVTVNGGNLTLNGAGVYVFQIAGTFDLGADAPRSIILENGATASNVFWAIAGEATIHASSVFNGELLGGSGIAAQAGATINGRLLAQTSVTLISDTVVET